MKTSEFLAVLASAGDRPVRFETQSGNHVPPGYHVTEVMNVHVHSVDCGGRESAFDKTVVQLWNGGSSEGSYLTAAKMNAIFDRVDQKNPLLHNEDIFFEWGDATTATSTYDVDAIDETGPVVIVKLFVRLPVCKPAAELLSNCCSGPQSPTEKSVLSDKRRLAVAETRPTGCC